MRGLKGFYEGQNPALGGAPRGFPAVAGLPAMSRGRRRRAEHRSRREVVLPKLLNIGFFAENLNFCLD